MRITEAARQVGVPVHRLRHYEAVALVVPDRTPAGYRSIASTRSANAADNFKRQRPPWQPGSAAKPRPHSDTEDNVIPQSVRSTCPVSTSSPLRRARYWRWR